MKKTTLALAILLSLGITACSSSGDTKYVQDNSAVEAANAKTAAAEKNVANLTQQLSTATSNVQALTTKLSAANDEVAALTAKLETTTSKNTANEAEIAQLKSDLAAAKSQVSTLRSQLATETTKSTNLANQLAQTQSELTEKTAALAASEAALAAAKSEADSSQQKIDAIYAKANRVSADKSLAYGTTEYDYVDNPNNAELRKALATEESTKALIAKIEAKENYTSCLTSKACDRYRSVDDPTRSTGSYDLDTGKLVHNYHNAYAGYAVIREEAYKNTALSGAELRAESNWIKDSAINSMFYYVNNPTTDKNAVVNASYTGRANYLVGYARQSPSNADRLTMNVTDGKISGVLKKWNNDAHYLALFNDGEIKEVNGVIGFNGTVTFNPDVTWGINVGSSMMSSYTGTYQGVFAGSGAEGLAGTFKTDDKQSVGYYKNPLNGKETTKDPKTETDPSKIKTIEGVFAAEKQQ